MPLQNRVTPEGEIIASAARGLVMGNRGGRFHRDDRTLGSRRWASRQWICCVLAFKGRRRAVMGRGYTELFFCDEVTALSAGHRPCFECRRADALRFQALFPGGAMPADDMDRRLQAERLDRRGKRSFHAAAAELPEGVMLRHGGQSWAVRGGRMLPWSPAGYGAPQPLPGRPVEVLTPPSIVAVLAAGYAPLWHPSAG